jgi:hypothetical protein
MTQQDQAPVALTDIALTVLKECYLGCQDRSLYHRRCDSARL